MTAAAPVPSQVRHPNRALARTVFQLVIGLAVALPTLVEMAHLPLTAGVVGTLAVAGVITRVMAIPAVDELIVTYFPWLAAEPIAAAARDEPGGSAQ